MVTIEMEEESTETKFVTKSEVKDNPVSTERSLDADELESLLDKITRPTARAQVESLVAKLRRDAAALKRVEASHKKMQEEGVQTLSLKPESAVAIPPEKDVVKASPKDVVPSNPTPLPNNASYVTVTTPSTAKFVPINRFAFDAGGSSAPFVSLYVDLPGVGSISRDNITCNFTAQTVDLQVHNLNGKSYRMFRDNLDKDINPEKSKFIVKPDKIIVKLAKCKGEYGSYDYWSDLTAKKKKTKASSSAKEDPSASIMELMKEMYDSGDDKMKKMIGETMMKQQRGELGKDGMMPDMGGFDGL